MPTMEANLVALRAEALVVVHLTRRPDVRITESPEDAFDLLATLCKRNRSTGKRFGIQLRAVLPNSVDGEFIRNAQNGKHKPSRRIPYHITFPVCEMVVNVVSDEINWRWLLKPVCEKAGKCLRTNPDTTLTLLTNQTVDAIVDAVNYWYAAI